LLIAAALVVPTAPFLLYPLVVMAWPRAGRRGAPRAARTVSVLIPAHNEADAIEAKLENVLSQRTLTPREIVVGCDGCSDDTVERVARYASRGVRALVRTERGGKASMLNALAEEARGDALVFTDASCHMQTGALSALLSALERGADLVTGRYAVPGAWAERWYWRFDTWLRSAASRRGFLIGAHGAAMALWRDAYRPFPEDTINDDYVLALEVHRAGGRVAYVTDAGLLDLPTPSMTSAWRRHERIAAGNAQMIARAGRTLLRPSVGAPLLLQKGAKLAAPLVAAAAWLSACANAGDGAAVQAFALAGALALVVAGAGLVGGARARAMVPPLEAGARALTVAAATCAGVWSAARGPLDPRWRRPEGDEELDLPAIPWSVRASKRALDVVGAAIGLTLASPVLLLLFAAIRLESRGPAVFRQTRVRHDERGRPRPFTMYKLRSMRSDAESSTGPVWAAENDDRITRVGAFLRASRLDELPQLWNVLRGDMSLVGPRPERPFFVDQLRTQVPGYDDRVARVRPGITGWAQIHCAYDTSLDSVRTKLLYDLTYVAHLYRWSTWAKMEARTVISTISVMTNGKGAR
jgi:lipopolysaccharide/colanic/teichoic acid biosynthesis glycosyltransferase